MHIKTFIYCANVWITSVVLGPVILVALALLKQTSLGIGFVPIAWILGLCFSTPSFFALLLISKYLVKLNYSSVVNKTLLSLSGILLTYIPFFVINGYHLLLDDDQLSKPLFLSYSAVLVIGIWLYKLNPIALDEVED